VIKPEGHDTSQLGGRMFVCISNSMQNRGHNYRIYVAAIEAAGPGGTLNSGASE
jgi:hypothetical protein